MAELPEYQPNSQVSPGPLVNAAPIHDAYAKMADDIEKTTLPIAQELRSQQVSQEATVAGSDPAFKTIPSLGAAAKEYNEIGLAANRQTVSADIMKNLTLFHEEAMKNGVNANSVNIYTQKAQAYLNGLMKTVPIENRGLAKNWWTAKSTQFQVSLQSKFNETLNRENTFHMYNNLDTYAGEMQSANMQGNTVQALSARSLYKSAIDLGIQTNHIKSPYAASQMYQKVDQNFHLSDYKGRITKLMNDPMTPLKPEVAMEERKRKVEELVKGFTNDPTIQKSFHTPALLKTAQKNLDSFYKQQLGQQHIDRELLGLQKSAIYDQAFNSGEVNENNNSSVISQSHESSVPLHMERVQANLLLHSVKDTLINGTKEQKIAANQMIKDVIEDSSNISKDPLTAQIYHKEFLKRSSALQSIYKQSQSNLADTVSQTKLYQQALNKISQTKLSGIDAANARSHAMISVEKSQNYGPNNYSVASTEQLNLLKSEINDSQFNVDPKIQQERKKAGQSLIMDMPTILGGIQHQFGNDPGVLNSIYNHLEKTSGIDKTKLTWLRLSSNQQNAGVMSSLSQAFNNPLSDSLEKYNRAQPHKITKKQLIDKFSLAASDVLDTMHGEVSINYDRSAQLRSNLDAYKSVGAQYAAWRMAYQSESPDVAAKNAADILINNQYTVSSLNNSQFLIPKTTPSGKPLDESVIKKIMQGTLVSEVRQNNLLVPMGQPGIDDDKKQHAYNFEALGSARVVRNGQGWNFIDESGNVMRTKDKTPLYLSYEDAADVKSPTAIKAIESLQLHPSISIAESIASSPYALKLKELAGSLSKDSITADLKDHPYWALMRHLLPENGYKQVFDLIDKSKERRT